MPSSNVSIKRSPRPGNSDNNVADASRDGGHDRRGDVPRGDRGGRGGRGGGGRGRGGHGDFLPPFRSCNSCGNPLRSTDRTICRNCRVRQANERTIVAQAAALASAVATLTESALMQGASQTPQSDVGRPGKANFGQRREQTVRGAREIDTKEWLHDRHGQSHSDNYRQRSAARPSRIGPAGPLTGRPGPMDHLRAPPGRRVPIPCRYCTEEGRSAAHNHLSHECMNISSVRRRAARRHFLENLARQNGQ